MKENKLVNNVTIGADPEMFLWSNKLNKFYPVCGLVGGTKKEPLQFTAEGHAVQEDNVMVEYCIPPSKTLEDFIKNIVFAKDYINETILKSIKIPIANEIGEIELIDPELVTKCIASANFDMQDLQADQAQEFGCESDYDVYTFEANRVSRTDPTLRSSGGHIHCGYDNNSMDVNIKLIKAFDLFLGLQSIILDPDIKRRTMYGKAGCYRIKPKYGFEYRTLSTFWTDSEAYITWAYEQAHKAIDFVNIGGHITNEQEIVDAINNSNTEKALEILDEYHIEIKEINNLITN